MTFRYRFIGKVNSQFVLRGLLFRRNSKIDFCVNEKEVEFLKEHCEIQEIIDRDLKAVEKPILAPKNVENQIIKIEEKRKGVTNGRQSSGNRKNKVNNTE